MKSRALKMMTATSICGPTDLIVLPRGFERTDWEVELAIVIGESAKNIGETRALDHIAEYALADNVSERHYPVKRCGQWMKDKSHDSFGPMEPCLVTRDEIVDVQNIPIWLEVDAGFHQNGNTFDQIFGTAGATERILRFAVLTPGDVITTGTLTNVGSGRRPKPRFLKQGQSDNLGGDSLGKQAHRVVAEVG